MRKTRPFYQTPVLLLRTAHLRDRINPFISLGFAAQAVGPQGAAAISLPACCASGRVVVEYLWVNITRRLQSNEQTGSKCLRAIVNENRRFRLC